MTAEDVRKASLSSYARADAETSAEGAANIWSRYITERTVLRVLISGFALVLLLLGAACFIAVRGTRSIQLDAETVMREELTVARLLNEVQAEETTLAAVLHRLILDGKRVNRAALLEELESADVALGKAAEAAQETPEAPAWRELREKTSRFSATARRAILEGTGAPETLSGLFYLHDDVVNSVQSLVTASTLRAVNIDKVLAGRSGELAHDSLALLGACFLLALICAVLTVRMATDSIRRIEWQASELARVSWHMLQGQEESARRFSHELHDELGQALAAIRANLSGVKPIDLEGRRTDCIHLVDEAIENVRELSQLLRPVILDDFGLDAALRWLTEKFSQRTHIEIQYSSTLKSRLADQPETHLFRIAQEALTNIARHSGATVVRVQIQEVSDRVTLTIQDNGKGLGFEANSGTPSLGMVGMRARAAQAGGVLRVSSPAEGGLKIQVEVPAVEELHELA